MSIRNDALRPLWALLVASVVVPGALFAVLAWSSYRAAFDDADREAERIGAVAREHAAKVFDSHKLVAERVNDLLRGLSDGLIRLSEADLHRAVLAIVADLPQVQSLVVVGADGHGLLATDALPIPPMTDFSDRDYFEALKSGAVGTYVSRVQVSRVNDKVFFGISRRRETATGAFDGVTDIAVAPQFFSRFYQTLLGEVGPDGGGREVTLVREDGQVLVRYPGFEEPLPQVTPPSPFFDAIRQSPLTGRYVSRSMVDPDHLERRYLYERVQGYPVYVMVGRSTASIIAGWRRIVAGYLAVGLPATAALFFVSATALRRTRREQVALAQARAEMRRREATEAVLHQSQKLEAVGQLTSGVAHDFNNLLTVIAGNLELMARSSGIDLRNQKRIEHMRAATDRGSRLTAQLLAFARKQRLDPRPLDLNEIVAGMQSLLESTIGGTVAIKVALEPALWPAFADRDQLELTILNLAINARDAMAVGGAIAIETGNTVLGAPSRLEDPPAGDYVVVAVTDHGAGMTPEVLARAFEPFFTTKGPGRGSGLGLSQVYGFARQSGGGVRIDSTVGVGTSVRVYLPRATDVPAHRAPPVAAVPAPNGQGVVLVVDDDQDVRAVTAQMLADLGYTIIEAGSGPAALERLDSEAKVALAVLDYAMPGMNGVELARAVQARRPGLPFLFVTGYANTEALVREVPATLILPKPFTADDLGAKVKGALGGAAAE